ncbi:MAG: 50S ribosomal protein L9 [Bacillota bacterium]
MKVILLQDVPSLGKKGDSVVVSPGYARNYLLPKGLVVEATQAALKEWDARASRDQKKASRELAQARTLAERLSQGGIKVAAKAGAGGRLFGSVTSKDLSEAVSNQLGLQIDRRKIHLEENLKSLGAFTVTVRLHPEVTANLKVKIVGDEGDDAR